MQALLYVPGIQLGNFVPWISLSWGIANISLVFQLWRSYLCWKWTAWHEGPIHRCCKEWFRLPHWISTNVASTIKVMISAVAYLDCSCLFRALNCCSWRKRVAQSRTKGTCSRAIFTSSQLRSRQAKLTKMNQNDNTMTHDETCDKIRDKTWQNVSRPLRSCTSQPSTETWCRNISSKWSSTAQTSSWAAHGSDKEMLEMYRLLSSQLIQEVQEPLWIFVAVKAKAALVSPWTCDHH